MTIPSFQRIESAAPMRADTFEAVKNNIIRFHPKDQPVTEPQGITALYERLSQEDRNEGESNSIANQKKILERYCKTHGYTPYRHYDQDDGFSGTNFDRPGFQEMLSDIKAGKIARVVVKDMSRFGRDYLQVGMYTDVVFPEYGVHFVAVNDGVDSTRGESEFTAIRNVFNEMYARDTSKKIRASFQSKGKSGEHLTFHAPYGYRKDPEDCGHWIVDEEAAAVVQKIYALCVDGLGPSQIARWLYENKILTPSEHFLESGFGKPRRLTQTPCWWTTETVSSILERVDYLGHTVNFKTYSKSYKNKKRHWSDPGDWAVFENTHEAIIEESTFAIVQNIRKTRRRRTQSGRLNEYAGLLFCANCGGKMYLSRRTDGNEKSDRFVCMTYRKGSGGCVAQSILKTVVDRIVLSNLREAIAYVKDNEADFIREAADLAEQERDKEIAGGKATLTKSERRIAELDDIIKRLYEDNVTGKLTDERFIKLSRDFEREQDNLKGLCLSLREDVKKQEKSKKNVKSFIAAAKKYTDLQELDATILHEFIDRINISPKNQSSKTREIEIVYNFIGAFDFTKTSKPSLEVVSGFEQRKIGVG